MGNTFTKTDTTADLLDEVARGLRLLRERLEEGKARWSMALVETRRPFDGWRWDRDAKEVGRSGEWVSWLNSPSEVALASETEWVLEVVNPNSISRSEGMPTTLAIHSGAVDRFTTERTDPSVAQYLREEIGDGSGFVLAVPFAGPVMDGAAWSLWAGHVGPPGPTMTYDRPHIAEREALRFDHNGVGGVVFVGVGPLRITPPDSAAWTLAVGLRFDGEPPTADQAEGLWDHLDEVLVAAGWDRLERESRSRLETTETPSPVTCQRFIENRATKMDPSVAALTHALRTQSLPIDSSAMRPWDALVEEEVARLQRDMGDSAFHRIPGVSEPLLKVVTKAGKRVVTLTKDGERELIDREGRKGFRRNYGDIEFLVKRVRIAGTDKVMEVRLSWQRAAVLISRDHRERLTKQLKDEEAEDKASLIKTPSAERARRYRALQLLGSCEDASALLLLCVSKFGPESGFQLRIPRWEIAGVLGINDHDQGGLRRIEAALRLLQELRFGVDSDEGGGISGEGIVVSEWFLEGTKRRPGEPGNPRADIDAVFTITLSAGAVGTLAAYFNGGAPKGLRHLESSTLAPWVVGAAGFTATQSRLWGWLRGNLTRMMDRSTLGPPVAKDSTPREYGETFCPLIPKGKTYYAALARFTFNPESGLSIRGCLIKHGGYDPPKGGVGKSKTVAHVLADLNAVVVETFGGMVVGRTKTRWVSLVELMAMAARTAENIPLFIFVPKDYAKREVEVVEAHQRGRKDRGETKVDVRVAESAEAYVEAMAPTTRDEEFRAEVVEYRGRLRVTQSQLAAIIGVDRTQLSRWEKGERLLSIGAKERLMVWLRDVMSTNPKTAFSGHGGGSV